jgi:hypothetical protein
MRLARILTVAVGALALTLAAQPASADVPAPEIGTLAASAVRNVDGPDTVRVVGRYRCWGPSEEMHVWVSVKQGGPDPTAEGSSSTVDAWYDTNISQDVAVTCDGHWHVKQVTLGRHPTDFTGRPLQSLHRGAAWLQFCLVPATSTEENFIFASKNRWVVVAGA